MIPTEWVSAKSSEVLRVNGDLTSKLILDVSSLDGIWTMFLDDLCELCDQSALRSARTDCPMVTRTFDTHACKSLKLYQA